MLLKEVTDPCQDDFLVQSPSIVCTRLSIVSSCTPKRFFVKFIRRLTKIFNKDDNQDGTKQRSPTPITRRCDYHGKSSPKKVKRRSQSLYSRQITNAVRLHRRMFCFNHQRRQLASLLLGARLSPMPIQTTVARCTGGHAQLRSTRSALGIGCSCSCSRLYFEKHACRHMYS